MTPGMPMFVPPGVDPAALPIEDVVMGGESGPYTGSAIMGISLVQVPANLTPFVALSAQTGPAVQRPVALAVEDEAQRIAFGPVLVPDQLIYRAGPPEHFLRFSRPVIRALAHRFIAEGRAAAVTKEHGTPLAGKACVVESYVADKPGKEVALGFDLPAGTWYAAIKISDDATWAEVKAGQMQGFSIESPGLFYIRATNTPPLAEPMTTSASAPAKAKNWLAGLAHKTKAAMSAPKAKPAGPVKLATSLMPATNEAGTAILLGQGESGEALMIPATGGELVPAPNGTYTTPDGPVVVLDGKFAEAEAAEAADLEAAGMAKYTLPGGLEISLPEGYSEEEALGADGKKYRLKLEAFEPEPGSAPNEPVASIQDVAALRAQLNSMQEQHVALASQIKRAQAMAGAAPTEAAPGAVALGKQQQVITRDSLAAAYEARHGKPATK